MLQEVTIESKPTPELQRFIKEIKISGFQGEVFTSLASRVVASSDNSIWQEIPEVVIAPRSHSCIEHLLKILDRSSHRSIAITARGGGTSTSGQTLTNSIVLDCKRHLHSILEYDEESKQVHVECGAVLDEVNEAISEFDVKIGPTVATSSRATIGGMIGNDSAGKGSSIYGKMSDCVVSLQTVLRGGTQLEENPDITSTIKEACDVARPYLDEFWPQLPRFATGYNLPMAWDGTTLDVNRLLCGSEGTLGITTSAILQCVNLPNKQVLALFCFTSFDEALKCGAELRHFKPSAIETVDEMVIEAARNSSSWESISGLLGIVQDDVNAMLFVEFTNEHVASATTAVAFVNTNDGMLHSTLLTCTKEINDVWSFRSRSVGLLSSIKGAKTPVPFVEDCAVPPESLAPFINDFKTILRKHELSAGMFGHVDAGVIHVRPTLDLVNAHDRSLVQSLTKEIATLVQSYGGILWGEHGKGFRSEFGPSVYGEVIWEQMCVIKHAFDPFNQLNPGKVAPTEVGGFVQSMQQQMRGELDEAIAPLPVLSNVTRCDGNSECESSSFESAMCPTYRVTGDPVHSPRGRANLIRHWSGHVGDSPATPKGSFFSRLLNSGNQTDFSHAVRNALDGCLSCKACGSNCPMQIDIPNMRAEFYDAYFGRYLRPIRDHVWFNMERLLPTLSTPIGKFIPSRLLASLIGIVDAPKVVQHQRWSISPCSPSEVAERKPGVVLLQDSFTAFFRPQVLEAFISLATYLKVNVALLHYKPSGKAFHIRGNLNAFKRVAHTNLEWLRPVIEANIPIVGIEPATTLLWRDEYVAITDSKELSNVMLPQEWLKEQDLSSMRVDGQWKLFPHCIEKAQAPRSQTEWQFIFDSLGGELKLIETACCGMGGLFGHEQEHKTQSLSIWNHHWLPHNPEEKNSLVTGYSCHSQAKRVGNISLLHPLEVLTNSIPSQ